MTNENNQALQKQLKKEIVLNYECTLKDEWLQRNEYYNWLKKIDSPYADDVKMAVDCSFTCLSALCCLVDSLKCSIKNSIRKMSTTKGVDLKKIIEFMEKFAPKSLAETWDNVGLLAEPTIPRLVESILLTNDLTEDVISEALNLNIGLIVSYHPPIFKPLTGITKNSWKERIIASCLENKIAIYSPHTSWDNVNGGINDWLASAFDVEDSTPINPMPNNQCLGAGRYCKLREGVKLSDAVEKVKELTCVNNLNLALARGASTDTIINNVAVCAGSGASILLSKKSDLYLTGEMSHHSLLEAIHSGTSVILCNHSNSERGFLKKFRLKLNENFGDNVDVFISEKDKDPLQIV